MDIKKDRHYILRYIDGSFYSKLYTGNGLLKMLRMLDESNNRFMNSFDNGNPPEHIQKWINARYNFDIIELNETNYTKILDPKTRLYKTNKEIKENLENI